MLSPQNHIATAGEKGTEFLLTNNLLIRAVSTLEALVYTGALQSQLKSFDYRLE